MCGGFLTVIIDNTPGAIQRKMFYHWPDWTDSIVLNTILIFLKGVLFSLWILLIIIVSYSAFIKNTRIKSAYWHFNTALLNDQAFRTALIFGGFLIERAGLPSPAFSSGGILEKPK